jgi:hypothetical protein
MDYSELTGFQLSPISIGNLVLLFWRCRSIIIHPPHIPLQKLSEFVGQPLKFDPPFGPKVDIKNFFWLFNATVLMSK